MRREAGLTQQKLCQLSGGLVSQTMVSRLERGQTVSLASYIAIAKLLSKKLRRKITPEDLGYTGEQQ